jgi:hypothetical protein
MHTGNLAFLAPRQHDDDLRRVARHALRPDRGQTPVTRVTLRQAGSGDAAGLRQLAELDSAPTPALPALVAEVDGRLRAALPLDGSAPIADPFHQGGQFIELLRVRASQLSRV